ncbi:WXG100 family type VII secretion target [Streptomyces sp. NPDC056500]|uniref:WXG100 family type VII secretion target n=1 Tax=Streptomyces sp. NPDC056500 TaxID=3345840 RepID=UPI00369F0933
MVEHAHLDVSEDDLTRLAGDLDAMQRHLDSQVRRMDAIVDRIEARWKGPAAKVYRALHQNAAEDAVRIREVLIVLEEAMRLSRDGFSERELDTLHRMRKAAAQVDATTEAKELSAENPPSVPRSAILDL